MLFSDRRRMKQVLMNLAGNAVKFTDQGNVTISARVPGDENLEIRVTDTGIGIKKEHMDKLFQPFPQIDVSLTKRHEGTGLGLHLSKKLVNLLGGDISAKSEYGRGSEFTFTIPLRYNKEGSKSEEDTGS
jgi:signal transduction histidine kinase